MIIKAILKPIFDSFFKSIIGATLIVSGLIKANDTIGFGIKLSDYFQDGALAYRVQDMFGWSSFSLEWLMDYSLYLAIFICVLEIVLGFCLIVGARIKETVFLLMSMLLFFLVLTLHTATCPGGTSAVAQVEIQCVSDCGCFGDALKFTPWGSFMKDLVLIILLIISSIITFDLHKVKKNRPFKVSYLNSLFDDLFAIIFTFIFTLIWCIIVSWYFPLLMVFIFFIVYFLIKKYYSSEVLIVLAISIVSLAFCNYTLNNLPIKDFRQYKIGTDVKADPLFSFSQNCNDCIPEVIIESTCLPDLPIDCIHPDACNYNPDWINHPDYNPALPEDWRCHFEEGHPKYAKGDQCEDCLEHEYIESKLVQFKSVILFISDDFHKSEKSVYSDINLLKEQLNTNGVINAYSFAGDPPSKREVLEILDGNNFLYADPEMSKMMIRSNPGILLMQNGIITQKWHYNNMPDIDEVLKILND